MELFVFIYSYSALSLFLLFSLYLLFVQNGLFYVLFCLFLCQKKKAVSSVGSTTNGNHPFAKPNPRPRCVVKANSVCSPTPASNKPQIAPRVRFWFSLHFFFVTHFFERFLFSFVAFMKKFKNL